MNRRQFLQRGAAALSAAMATPLWLRANDSAVPNHGRKLLVIFQRGGNDAVNTLVPVGDRAEYERYRAGRPNLHLPQSDLLSLQTTDFFGFHPSLAPMAGLINSGRVSCVQAVGYPDMNTSHFVSQAYWETGDPANRHGAGWLNRYLQATYPGQPLRGLMIDRTMAQMMSGPYTVPVSENFGAFAMPVPQNDNAYFGELMRDLAQAGPYGEDKALRNTTHRLLTMFDNFADRDLAEYQPNAGARYPDSAFGQRLKHAVQMLKDEPSTLNVEAVMVNQSNYDHHSGQIGDSAREGAHADLLHELAQGIQAVTTDLGAAADKLLILVVSEFGRTLRENGSRGTDHGGGALTMLIGAAATGAVRNGGDDWPGMTDHKLPWVTDYRDIYWEILERWLGANPAALREALPNFTPTALNLLA